MKFDGDKDDKGEDEDTRTAGCAHREDARARIEDLAANLDLVNAPLLARDRAADHMTYELLDIR